MAEMLAGDAAAAERALDDAERIAVEIGDRWFQSTILVDRAHAILAQDRPGAAAEAVARIDDVPAPSDMEWRVKRHAARAKLAALEGDADRALREARAATALADATEMFTFRADAHRDLAEVAARCGRHEEARAATATALALYEAKENVAAAAQLRAALELNDQRGCGSSNCLSACSRPSGPPSAPTSVDDRRRPRRRRAPGDPNPFLRRRGQLSRVPSTAETLG